MPGKFADILIGAACMYEFKINKVRLISRNQGIAVDHVAMAQDAFRVDPAEKPGDFLLIHTDKIMNPVGCHGVTSY